MSASDASGGAAVGVGVAEAAEAAAPTLGRAAPALPMSAIEKPGPTGPESRSIATPNGLGAGVGAGVGAGALDADAGVGVGVGERRTATAVGAGGGAGGGVAAGFVVAPR